MRTALFRSRGQAALFAGIVLALVLPLVRLAALIPTGYDIAAQASSSTRNYAPLLAWAAAHAPLVVVTAALGALPFILILPLPYTLRRAVFGATGRAAQWVALAGIALLALLAIADLVLLLAYGQQYAGAASGAQGTIGASYRFIAIGAALIANVLGGTLLTIWLVVLNLPLARLEGFERIVGFIGILSAALFGATALLSLFDPQQPQGAIVGTAQGAFGAWLILAGALLIQRAPQLGEEAGEQDAHNPADEPPNKAEQDPGAVG